MIPRDPVMLLSYVNTQLRDYYESLEALCSCRGIQKEDLLKKMEQIDYHYSVVQTKFICRLFLEYPAFLQVDDGSD